MKVAQANVTVTFSSPFVLSNTDLVGLRMEFDLRQSLQVDGNGQVTGVINPTFEMALLNSTDAEVSIDDFDAGWVGVTGPNTFTVQGPKGRQWMVQTDDNTIFDDPDEPISSFTFNENLTAGILLPSPLTVFTTNSTNFINLSGLSALTGSQSIPVRVVGFILFDPATQQSVMVARYVEELTD